VSFGGTPPVLGEMSELIAIVDMQINTTRNTSTQPTYDFISGVAGDENAPQQQIKRSISLATRPTKIGRPGS